MFRKKMFLFQCDATKAHPTLNLINKNLGCHTKWSREDRRHKTPLTGSKTIILLTNLCNDLNSEPLGLIKS